MNDDAIAGKLGAHRCGKFFIFLRENPGFDKHDHTAPEPAHRLRQREPIWIGADHDKTPGQLIQRAE